MVDICQTLFYMSSFDVKKVSIFSRRIFIITALKSFAFFIIIFRLFHLQIFSYKKYLEKSNDNRVKSFIIPPNRGIIMSSDGKKIAYNSTYWRVIYKGNSKNSQTISKVLHILAIPEEKHAHILKQYTHNIFDEFIIYEFLTESQLTAIEINIPILKDVYITEGVARYYKDSMAYSNIIGYVRFPTENDMKTGKSKHPDIKLGVMGIEGIHNDTLTGTYGVKVVETNALGQKVQNLSIVKPISGSDITLTLDTRIQEFMLSLSGNRTMSSVIMNSTNGNILGIVSSPTFDANKFSQRISSEEWNDIIHDKRKPMFNRVYQAQYPPGSIFKIIIAIAALQNGYNPERKFYCNGSHQVGRQTFRCWKPTGHGKMDLHNAIKHSCNVYFYNLADYITLGNIYETATELGFHQTYDSIGLTGQVPGFIPSEKWASLTLKGSWFKGDLINTIIGQGSVLCNALQLCVAMARISSGKKVFPYTDVADKTFENLALAEENLAFIKNAMFDGANTPGGTSYASRIVDTRYQFAGKTGTSQVISKYVKLGEKYKVEYETPNGLFAGFAPCHSPTFSIATIYENGGYGSSCALPFASKVLYYTQKLYAGEIEEAENFRKKQIEKLINTT